MAGRTALLMGATGLIGTQLLKLLLEDSAYGEVRVLTRRPLKQTHLKLQELIVDFDTVGEAARQFVFQVDDVFCCLGTTIKKAKTQKLFRKVDWEYPTIVARLAQASGASQFLVVSALGANANSRIFYSRVKGELENDLIAMGYSSLHIFRPSLLLGQRQEFRLGESLSGTLYKMLPGLFNGFMRRYKPIEAGTVAAAMLQAAKRKLAGIHIYESGEISQLAKLE